LTGVEGAPAISIVIVSWNTCDLLRDCLRALEQHPAHGRIAETIVVDNGSRDGTAEMVRDEWPSVHLIENTENAGYTRANNQAIRSSRGEYIVLINADASVQAGCLDTMLSAMDADERIGAVGPRLVYGDGRWQRWTGGRAPSLRTAFNYFLFLERLSPDDPRFAGIYLGRDIHEGRSVDWVSSACMLLRLRALEQVGLLDERFFVYMDDVDLCQRLRDAGWKIRYCPEAQATHLMGQSTKRQTGGVSPEALRSFNRYFAGRYGSSATATLRVIEAIGFAIRAVAYLAAAAIRRDEPRLSAQAAAHWQYFRVSVERQGRRT
jgi:N-acetylglucosaminyl-diphospho-decaprenol L-rhamnosyltransferase